MKLTGSQIFVEVLVEQGVDTLFGYPGGAVLNLYDELYKNSDRIRHVLTAHEQGASHAADGYARATGRTGVVLATSGTVRLYLKTKGYDRALAVTDSIMAAGLPDGSYKLGVNDVIVENGDAKLPNGVRAGSTLTMAQALRNLMAFTGEGAETVSRLMTANPARLMGWAGKGELDVGKDADLVLLDGDYQVARTVVGGRTVYTR